MTSITRLKQTWSNLSRKYPKTHEQFLLLSDIVSPKQQYAKYRKCIQSWTPPILPFFGVFLTDLTFAELGSPDLITVKNDIQMINFGKRLKLYKILKDLEAFQNQSCPVSEAPTRLFTFLWCVSNDKNDSDIFSLSCNSSALILNLTI